MLRRDCNNGGARENLEMARERARKSLEDDRRKRLERASRRNPISALPSRSRPCLARAAALHLDVDEEAPEAPAHAAVLVVVVRWLRCR